MVVTGLVGEDVKRRATDGVSRSTASLGEDSRIYGCRRQNSMVVQEVDSSVGKIHRIARQLVFNERVCCLVTMIILKHDMKRSCRSSEGSQHELITRWNV